MLEILDPSELMLFLYLLHQYHHFNGKAEFQVLAEV